MTMVMLLVTVAPAPVSAGGIAGKFLYALSSVDYYTAPQTVQKKSPDGTPIPSGSSKIGFLMAGSLLEVLERREGWLRVRPLEGAGGEGWIREDRNLAGRDPRLYFRAALEGASIEGYAVFNAAGDLSCGSVTALHLTDRDSGDLPVDLAACLALDFAGNQVEVTLADEEGARRTLGGRLAEGDCYLVSKRLVKLNQSARPIHLQRTRASFLGPARP